MMCRFPKELWAPFCLTDLELRNEKTNNVLERCWQDLKNSISTNKLGPQQLIAELHKYDKIKMADLERRISGPINGPKRKQSNPPPSISLRNSFTVYIELIVV